MVNSRFQHTIIVKHFLKMEMRMCLQCTFLLQKTPVSSWITVVKRLKGVANLNGGVKKLFGY